MPPLKHPEYVYCHFKKFLSQWAVADLRDELDIYKSALEAIALEEDSEQAGSLARQALVAAENAEKRANPNG